MVDKKSTWRQAIGLSLIFMIFILVSLFNNGGNNTTISIVLFGAFVIFLILLKGYNTKVLLYDSYMTFTDVIIKKKLSYTDFSQITREKRKVGSGRNRTSNYFFVFYDGYSKELIKIPVSLFGTASNQTTFLRFLQEKNNRIVFDHSCLYIMKGDETFYFANDVIGKKIGNIFQLVVIGIITISFAVPLLFLGIAKLIEYLM